MIKRCSNCSRNGREGPERKGDAKWRQIFSIQVYGASDNSRGQSTFREKEASKGFGRRGSRTKNEKTESAELVAKNEKPESAESVSDSEDGLVDVPDSIEEPDLEQELLRAAGLG